MSDYTLIKDVKLFGKNWRFRALSGIVINADQRSDTYVSSTSNNVRLTSVSSNVVVTSDIWIRGLSGKEYRLRYKRDIPVREGNVLHSIDIIEADDSYTVSNGDVLIYNSTIREWFYTGGMNAKLRNAHATRFFLLWLLIPPIFVVLIRPNPMTIFYAALVGFAVGVMGVESKSPHNEKSKRELGVAFRPMSNELDAIATQISESIINTAWVVNKDRNASHELTHQKFCSSCGTGVMASASFCSSCGGKLAEVV